MSPLLQHNLFLVKEHIGLFKAANNFDILNPQTGEIMLECREERLGLLTRLLRFSDLKRKTPFEIDIRTPVGEVLVRVRRGFAFFISNVEVQDGNGQTIGGFRQKFFSIGGRFTVVGSGGQDLCQLRGSWTGWDFRFEQDGRELARISKKWAGLGKEFLTSADNYMLQISDSVPREDPVRPLILAAVMCIDMVLKE